MMTSVKNVTSDTKTFYCFLKVTKYVYQVSSQWIAVLYPEKWCPFYKDIGIRDSLAIADIICWE